MIRAVSVYSTQGAHPAQEDHVLVQDEKGIFVIADGFGGPAPGAHAAKTACEAVKGFLFKEAGDLDATLPFEIRSYFSLAGNVLFNGLVHANNQLLKSNSGKNVHEKGGASVLAGYVDGRLLALANVGACSAWLIREGKAVELVTPRTYARLRDPFAPQSDAEGGRIPLIALGVASDLQPEIFEFQLRPGDWVMAVTSGFSAALRERVSAIQVEGLAPTVSADRVLEVFQGAEFKDNASFSLIIF